MIVQPGASQPGILKLKTERMNEVEPSACVRAEPDDIARVGRYLRLLQHDMKHDQSARQHPGGQRELDTGLSFQIMSLYSWMVRSEENLPAAAVFRMLMRVQPRSSR